MADENTLPAIANLLSWPGKSALAEDQPEHPAVYHMLDVASVAECLVRALGLPQPTTDAFIVLAALHDLGKISTDFRNMLRGGQSQGIRHWELTEVYLNENIGLLSGRLSVADQAILRPLISATAGHHGRPSRMNETSMHRALFRTGVETMDQVRRAIVHILELWPGASLAGLTHAEALRLSWWLPGLVAAADWIGSNPDWFPAQAPTMTLASYRDYARECAARAVAQAGLSRPDPAPTALFAFDPRPMQVACAEIPLSEGPILAVIEDETGAGKTEAAMILAQRMLMARKGRGLFLALPTMATADAMFARASKIIGRMFVTPPTVTLAHGRSNFSHYYQDIKVGSPNAPQDVGCTGWLADSRRRALLADVGVGTIDQVLLSALPVKWQTLRHYGLSSKILIVDEVHELGEPYIAAALERVLEMHRAVGGSAILLTATLPLALRRRLMAVYAPQADGDPAYPALTIAGGSARRDLPQQTGPRGPVAVARLDGAGPAVALLVSAAGQGAGQGAACVWVRNAVDDAIAGVTALRAAGVKADLLHARFALVDRKRIEAQVLARFGKDGTGREGRVLVGTQVLESSLDLDFDVMVSDLAPMAALIQRAGRLWRHMDRRPGAGRPVAGPVLHVVSPDPAQVTDARWLSRVLDRGAHVYPQPLLWRTADVLFREGRIVAPAGLRALIEAAHSDNAAPVPGVLEHEEITAEGQALAAAALAWQNLVRPEAGYRAGGQSEDDATYPTRLGLPQLTLLLVTEDGAQLRPWGGDAFGTEEMLSEVTAAEHRLRRLPLPDQAAPAIARLASGWPDWRRPRLATADGKGPPRRLGTWVCPVGQGGRICEGLWYDADYGLLFASSYFGDGPSVGP